jgi:peptidyl-dipeptidase Dcp
MYMARNTVCTHDNSENNLEICKRLVNLRREIAQLLGYKTYADYVLKRRMASNTKGVYRLLNDLIDAYKPTAVKEREELKKLFESQMPKAKSQKLRMEPWDSGFYTHKLQMKKYNIDQEMLRPYFELSNVIKGVFGLANKLYGISFKENKDIPVYHPDVKAYEVFDKDGSYLAVFYADFHPRKGKQGGAWMTEYQGQYIDKKGEFEKTEHFEARMKDAKMQEEYLREIMVDAPERYLEEKVWEKGEMQLTIGEYNADEECFPIAVEIAPWNSIMLPVPMD